MYVWYDGDVAQDTSYPQQSEVNPIPKPKNTLTLTAKIKILPTPEQSEKLLQTLRAYRAACNDTSQLVFESQKMSVVFLHKQSYRHLRETYALRSQMAQRCSRPLLPAIVR